VSDASQAEVWRLTEEWFSQREALFESRSECRKTRHALIDSEHRCTQLILRLADAGISVDSTLLTSVIADSGLFGAETASEPQHSGEREEDEEQVEGSGDCAVAVGAQDGCGEARGRDTTAGQSASERRHQLDMSFEGFDHVDPSNGPGNDSPSTADGFRLAVTALTDAAHAYTRLPFAHDDGSAVDSLISLSQFSAERFPGVDNVPPQTRKR
jgi:hypothetical protein